MIRKMYQERLAKPSGGVVVLEVLHFSQYLLVLHFSQYLLVFYLILHASIYNKYLFGAAPLLFFVLLQICGASEVEEDEMWLVGVHGVAEEVDQDK